MHSSSTSEPGRPCCGLLRDVGGGVLGLRSHGGGVARPAIGFALRRPFHLLLPRSRNVRRAGVTVHTTTVLPPIDRETCGGIPVTSPTRTLIDLAGHETPARLTAALDGAVRDGLTSEDLLHRRIAALRTKGRHGIPILFDVLAGRGGHPWRAQLAGARVPAARRRPRGCRVRSPGGARPCRRPVRPRRLPLPRHRRRRRAARLSLPPLRVPDGARRRASERPRACRARALSVHLRRRW